MEVETKTTPKHSKREVVYRQINTATVICQDHKDFNREIEIIKQDLKLNGYPQCFTDCYKVKKNNNPSTDRLSLSYQGKSID
jgi:hypothetical protein